MLKLKEKQKRQCKISELFYYRDTVVFAVSMDESDLKGSINLN